MTDREKLIELVKAGHGYYYSEQYSGLDSYEAIADYLIANGVVISNSETPTKSNYKHLYEQTKKMLTQYQDELIPGFRKQIEELEGTVCDLRKKWLMAETHICTMCEHFDHKADGNIVYGNMNCGELVGYPCCGKFKLRATDNNVGSKWISVTERLPSLHDDVLMYFKDDDNMVVGYLDDVDDDMTMWSAYSDGGYYADCDYVPTHWMPLPEAPKENDDG